MCFLHTIDCIFSPAVRKDSENCKHLSRIFVVRSYAKEAVCLIKLADIVYEYKYSLYLRNRLNYDF